LPPLTTLLEEVKQLSVVGQPGNFAPLILDHKQRLYLHRYWTYENQLARQILARATAADADEDRLRLALEKLFGPSGEADWQKFAAFTAVTKKFCVLSGGPGTGKTRTVVMILAALLMQQPGRELRVALCAPTGKAAARLKESIEAMKATLPLEAGLLEKIPKEATTIHRLLGTIPNSTSFRHHAANPLSLDVLIVDEASMVDLALMARLLDAVPASTRVVLLGDKNQLASVEAGAVLGDICHHGETLRVPASDAARYEKLTGEKLGEQSSIPARPLDGHIVELVKNYRFGGASGIFQFSQRVNAGDANGAFECLRVAAGDVQWRELPRVAELRSQLKPRVLEGFRDYLRATDPASALAAFNDFRILCATRQGTFGVATVNTLVESILADEGLIRPVNTWYTGRPVMVTRNDYNVNLFNGDIGIVLPDNATGELRACFQSADGVLRQIAVSRLPDHETAFAMTIHKSQGSEFKKVLMILPEHESAILTRELIYTGATRARTGVELWMNEAVGRLAIERRIARNSGLQDALWETR
jgi:exodeoxyribonuclease V alpha subunit